MTRRRIEKGAFTALNRRLGREGSAYLTKSVRLETGGAGATLTNRYIKAAELAQLMSEEGLDDLPPGPDSKPRVIVAALQAAVAGGRKKGRRSKSANTLRALLTDLCRLAEILGDLPFAEMQTDHLRKALGDGSGGNRYNSAVAWIVAASKKLKIVPPSCGALGRAPRYTHSDRIDRANLDAAIVRSYRHDGPLLALLLISFMVGRRSEVLRLTLRDVVITAGEGGPARLLLTIRAAKGDKLLRQCVPLDRYPSDMVEDLCLYLWDRVATEGVKALVVTPLTVQGGAQRAIDQVALTLSEVGCRWHPHSTRHAFVTALAQEGEDVAEISERMGHVGVDTTLGYVDFDPASIAIDEAHHQEMLGGEVSVAGIMVLRGVGRRRAEQLRACGLRSPRQLLTAPPR